MSHLTTAGQAVLSAKAQKQQQSDGKFGHLIARESPSGLAPFGSQVVADHEAMQVAARALLAARPEAVTMVLDYGPDGGPADFIGYKLADGSYRESSTAEFRNEAGVAVFEALAKVRQLQSVDSMCEWNDNEALFELPLAPALGAPPMPEQLAQESQLAANVSELPYRVDAVEVDSEGEVTRWLEGYTWVGRTDFPDEGDDVAQAMAPATDSPRLSPAWSTVDMKPGHRRFSIGQAA